MSADNSVYVYELDGKWFVFHGMDSYISSLSDDQLARHVTHDAAAMQFGKREDAIMAAHDWVKSLDVCEYGVTEL